MPSSQLLFLIDLDLCLPLTWQSTSTSSSLLLPSQLSDLRRILLRLLCSQSKCHGVNADRAETVQFACKFYSSTGYFMVRQDQGRAASKAYEFKVSYPRSAWSHHRLKHGSNLQNLSRESFEELDVAVSDHFERLVAPGAASKSFSGEDLQKHYDGVKNRKSEAEAMAKALEEIAVSGIKWGWA